MRSCPACNSVSNSKEIILNDIPLVRCDTCDFVYADIEEFHANDVNSSYSDAILDIYESNRSAIDDIWFEYVVNNFSKKLGTGKVLDVGCGDCFLLTKFKKFGWECTGIDVSPWAETAAGKHGIEFVKGFIENGYFEKQSFDLVVSSSTLEHIFHPKRHLSAIAELIKPGGMLYIFGVPNYGSISIKANISAFDCNMPPGHVNSPTAETVKNLFPFEKEKVIVKTYGIPELHRLYRKGLSLKTKSTKKPAAAKPVNSTDTNAIVPRKSKLKTFLQHTAVKGNYWFGRPFKLGDKLEIIVRV